MPDTVYNTTPSDCGGQRGFPKAKTEQISEIKSKTMIEMWRKKRYNNRKVVLTEIPKPLFSPDLPEPGGRHRPGQEVLAKRALSAQAVR